MSFLPGPEDYDLIIVGAGPVGLFLRHKLQVQNAKEVRRRERIPGA